MEANKMWRQALWIVCLVFYSIPGVVHEDNRRELTNDVIENGPLRCEDNNNVLDVLAQNTAPDDLIIVIARLGDGENNSRLNQRRMHNVKVFLTEFLADRTVKRKPETVLVAQGERAKGFWRVELFVNGKLYQALMVKKNSDLIVGYCSRDPPEKPCPPIERNLYPCRDRFGKR